MKEVGIYHICKVVILFVVGGYVFSFGVSRPINNWDLVGYVAASCQMDGNFGSALSACVYSDIKRSVPEYVYSDLISGEYRLGVFKDHVALQQQVPFYSIRVVYVAAMRLISGVAGVSYTTSTHLISAVFAAFLAINVCAWLLGRQFGLVFSFVLVSILIDRLGIRDLARLSSPDSMAAFLFVFVAYLKSVGFNRFGFFLSILFPLIRTDFLLAAWLFQISFLRTQGLRSVSLLMLLSLFSVIWVNDIFGYYGWGVIISFTFVKQVPYPSLLDGSIGVIFYSDLVWSALISASESPHAVVYIVATGVSAVLFVNGLRSKVGLWMYFIPIAFVVLHLMLFPAYMSRFFVAPVCLLLIWFAMEFRTSWRYFARWIVKSA